jgi:hypothetical protein
LGGFGGRGTGDGDRSDRGVSAGSKTAADDGVDTARLYFARKHGWELPAYPIPSRVVPTAKTIA